MGEGSIFIFVLLTCYFLFSLSIFPAMQILKVGSLNINGMRDGSKRALLVEFLKLKETHVTFLQETHSDQKNESEIKLWWEGKTVFSHGTNISAGVAILFSKYLNINIISEVEIEKGRIMLVKAKVNNQLFEFINIYAPNKCSEKFAVFKKLKDFLNNYTLEGFLIVGGDWNCTLNFLLDRNNQEPHPASASFLKSFIIQNDLVDVWRDQNAEIKHYTWTKINLGMISVARLDRFYVKCSDKNRVSGCNIFPCCLSDHNLITVSIVLTQSNFKSPYWKLNTALLKEKQFYEKFKLFWEEWSFRKKDLKNLLQWWELGKIQIKIFCQQYTWFSTRKIKQKISEIEHDICHITSGMIQHSDSSSAVFLSKKNQDLKSLLQVRAKGALIRSRFMSLHEMDAPTSYFFNLEKVSKKQNEMYCLKTPEGLKTFDPEKMRKIAVDFYSDLYKKEETNIECMSQIMEKIPTLTETQRKFLDSAIPYQELMDAVKQMKTGRAPGIDGLSIDFYKSMWNIIGNDFYEVIQECFKEKSLPTSCQRAVLTLLPKKGDLSDLKNWRPVSVLTTDYKLMAKVLANRLKTVLGDLIHPDQSYCIPDRTIYDNIFMVRDILDYSKLNDVNVGFLFLDQEKAFDRVDHGFLFETMRAFGFGNVFISWIKLLYTNASCVLKIGGSLSKPVRILKGIRQGCPLSGQLYALAVEPLLCLLRDNLSDFKLDDICNSVKVIAYADDIAVLVKNQKDVDVVKNSISLFESASSAKLNWIKTEAFWCNEKSIMRLPVIPENVKWKKHGFKYLGIFLGSESYQRNNWENVKEKVCNRLSKWNWILPQLSYRGRVLVINNLAASVLWHKLIVLNPPDGFIREIQKVFIDFFWNGNHWLKETILYLQLNEGGQGLMDIKSKVAAFRLQTAQKLLYQKSLNWTAIACTLLNRVGRMNLNRHLFLMNLKDIDFNGLSSFYTSVLNAWQIFIVKRELTEVTQEWVLEEPLVYNPLLVEILKSKACSTRLIQAGICKICHLRIQDSWISAEKLAEKINVHSVRFIEKLLYEVQKLFPVVPLQTEVTKTVFPRISVKVNLEDWQEDDTRLLSFKTPQLGFFNEISKKSFYCLCVKFLNLKSLREIPETKWGNFVEIGTTPKGCWRSLYKAPIEKRSGDLQWRISHWILATNRYKNHLNPVQGDKCIFCGLSETMAHLIIGCSRLFRLFDMLRDLCQNLGFIFTNSLFIFGPKYNALNKKKIVLTNFLLGKAKLAVWLTRKNKILLDSNTDPLDLFRILVKSRLVMEYKYYELVNDVDSFFLVWGVENILCQPNEEGGCDILL